MPDDQFTGHQPGLQSPAQSIEAITPSDGSDLANVTRALNVTGAGNVRLMTPDGQIGDVYIAAGIPFPVRAIRVLDTGTTATGIRGLS